MTRKITVSLDDALADEAHRVLVGGGRSPSFSAAVAEALGERLERHRRARGWLDRELAAARERDPEGFAAARARGDEARARLAALDGDARPQSPDPSPGSPQLAHKAAS
jgi:Arc/MetJ-type ribon-helix-helix transcriptional regulator